jgi:hypothetical protein
MLKIKLEYSAYKARCKRKPAGYGRWVLTLTDPPIPYTFDRKILLPLAKALILQDLAKLGVKGVATLTFTDDSISEAYKRQNAGD